MTTPMTNAHAWSFATNKRLQKNSSPFFFAEEVTTDYEFALLYSPDDNSEPAAERQPVVLTAAVDVRDPRRSDEVGDIPADDRVPRHSEKKSYEQSMEEYEANDSGSTWRMKNASSAKFSWEEGKTKHSVSSMSSKPSKQRRGRADDRVPRRSKALPSDHDDPLQFPTTSSSKKAWDTQYPDEDTVEGRKVLQRVQRALVNAGVYAHPDATVEISDDSEGVELEVEYDAQALHEKKERRRKKRAMRKQQPSSSTQDRPGGSSSESPPDNANMVWAKQQARKKE